MVMGTDTHTASLYELAFTPTRSVSGQCCEVKHSSWMGDPGIGAGATG